MVSVTDASAMDRSRRHCPRRVSDAYLLALATANGGHFVTVDRSVLLSAVPGATSANLVVL